MLILLIRRCLFVAESFWHGRCYFGRLLVIGSHHGVDCIHPLHLHSALQLDQLNASPCRYASENHPRGNARETDRHGKFVIRFTMQFGRLQHLECKPDADCVRLFDGTSH